MKSRHLNNDEVAILSAVCRSKEWLPLELSSLTGLRIGDVLKIQRKDLNTKESFIHYVAEKTGKEGKAYISRGLMEILDRECGTADSDFLFRSPKKPNAHLTRQAAWQRIKRACKSAGVNPAGVSPHSMRKVFAVNLYHKEGIAAVQKQLQHSSLDVTEIYALADWLASENENLPILRKDIARIAHIVCGYVEEKLSKNQGADDKETA